MATLTEQGAPDDSMPVTLSIYEECRYTVTGASVYEAMMAFLADPSHYLMAVEERNVLIRRGGFALGADNLTDEETAEVERAKNDS